MNTTAQRTPKGGTTPWRIYTLTGFRSGRTMGYGVERVVNAYTDKAKTELLMGDDGSTLFPSEAAAQAAIDNPASRIFSSR